MTVLAAAFVVFERGLARLSGRTGAAVLCGAALHLACDAAPPPPGTASHVSGGSSSASGGAGGSTPATGGSASSYAGSAQAGSTAGSFATGGVSDSSGGGVDNGTGGTGDTAAGGSDVVVAIPCGMSTGSDPLIDDFEDSDLQVKLVDGRNGYWETFDDSSIGAVYSSRFPGAGVGRGGTVGFCTDISGYTVWGANIVANMSGPKCGYDASPYSGVCFWAKGKVNAGGPVVFAVGTSDTVPVSSGGACVGVDTCNSHYEAKLALTDTYTQFCFGWSELSLPSTPGAKPFDASHLVQMEWKFPADSGKSTDGTLCIDDIAFQKK